MIVPVMAMLTRQIYSEETKGAHAHNRDGVPLIKEEISKGDQKLNALMQATIIIIKNCKILGYHNIFDSIYYEHVAQRQ